MLLGKRPRHPMKRTTSMTEFTLDLNTTTTTTGTTTTTINGEIQPSDTYQNPFSLTQKPVGYDGTLMATVSPRNHRRNSSDVVGTGHFLRSCSLCKRRLVPGRDIYMYRGDSAFCSHECRQQQIIQDERNEKCSFVSAKKGASSSATGPEGETVAAM